MQYAMCVPCVVGSNERGGGDSRSPSHSSGALIGSCRESYARQATREKRLRETIQYPACMHCVACSNERERGDPRKQFPFPQFRRTDWQPPSELCQASHS